MTRSYRKRRITQPIAVASRPRDPAIGLHSFTCFRLVPDGDRRIPLRLHHSDTRMFAFARAFAA